MTTFKTRIAVRFFSIVSFLILSAFELAGEMKEGGGTSATQNTIEIKDFQFSPQTLKVKSGQSITWINRDDEPHTVVSVEKQFRNHRRSTPIKALLLP